MKIMLVGDSRVRGYPRRFESYRYELWKNLVAEKWDYEIIGPCIDCEPYPDFMGEEFARKHFSMGGYLTKDILTGLPYALKVSGTPDVVLLGIGGNNMLQEKSISEAIDEVMEIIDILQSANEKMTIFIEQIVSCRTAETDDKLEADIDEYNRRILDVVKLKGNELSKVIPVDMRPNFTDEHFEDAVHYNKEGAKIIADKYFDAMKKHLM